MRKLTLILIITLMTCISAKASCLEDQGHKIMTLIGLKSRIYIKYKNEQKIGAKYDSMESKMNQDCNNSSEGKDCSYIATGIKQQKANELDGHLGKALSDTSWCNDEEMISNMRNVRDQKVKFCENEDAGTFKEKEYFQSAIEDELNSSNNAEQESCLRNGTLEAWKGVSPRTINLPTKQLCETVLRKMKTIVQKCESKSVAKKSSSAGCEIADADGTCTGGSSTLTASDVGVSPDNGAGKIEIKSVKHDDVDLGMRKRRVSNSGGSGSSQ